MTTPKTPDHETLLTWVSALLDGELAPAQEDILVAAMDEDDGLVAFFEAQIALREALSMGPRGLSTSESTHLTQKILDGLEASQQVDLEKLSAAMDNEADFSQALVAKGGVSAGDALSFVSAQEAVQTALCAPMQWPEAERAGAQALAQIQDAPAQPSQSIEVQAPAAEVISITTRIRAWAIPAVGAVAAALAIMFIGYPNGTLVDDDDWQKDLLASWEAQISEDNDTPDALPLLGDNSDTEVLALGTDTDTAMVFSLPESKITVIWAPESMPDDEDSPAEQGT